MKRFFGQPSTIWASLRNRLHVYALPDPELRAALVDYQRALTPFSYCSVQPPKFLHATVQQFAVTSEEVTQQQLAAFASELERLASSMKPFEIALSTPVADDWSLGVRGKPSLEWENLVSGVRSAAQQTINLDREMPRAPFGPHLTLGYGVAQGSSEQVQAASDALKLSELPPLKVQEIHFLAVHQDVEHGIFHWDSSQVFRSPR
ncbi:2'-5' RNA ligase [Psychromicrobium silvestre]|uniref:2'-5' RNA ligase n=1 Tax=Psychromicrobium silvestre TaxID=1645614 RepID=A0A7Y9LW25_9MICC|nr:2'-5' RNA ligase family protein [Psychromicrobium silvestre]NYE96632.1 2'-5' RNA ligase [Psychromicrobium silvestre]